MSAPTVVVAADHRTFRAGVSRALESGGFNVRAEAADARGAIAAAFEHRPDACLLEVEMPGGGITAADQIYRSLAETSIVMLAGSRDEGDFFAALRAGAVGYVFKEVEPEQLPVMVSGVLSGDAVLPPSLVARVVEEFRGRRGRRRLTVPRRGPVGLTSREWEVLKLLQSGESTSQIASDLSISRVTVRRHISEIVHKLGVATRDAALELLGRAST